RPSGRRSHDAADPCVGSQKGVEGVPRRGINTGDTKDTKEKPSEVEQRKAFPLCPWCPLCSFSAASKYDAAGALHACARGLVGAHPGDAVRERLAGSPHLLAFRSVG